MRIKQHIKPLLDDQHEPTGRYTAYFIQALIAASLVSFSLETLPDLTQSQRFALRMFEVFSVGVFTIEYLARIWTAERRLAFVFSFYGLIDLIAILPFYLASGLDLRSLRAFRLLRLLRLLKLFRYSASVNHFRAALHIARDDLLLFTCVTLILLHLSAIGIYHFEHEAQPEAYRTLFDALWWAVATLTTVGYGDIYPVTLGGRLFTFMVLMIGLGVVAVPTGLLASALSEARRQRNNTGKGNE